MCLAHPSGMPVASMEFYWKWTGYIWSEREASGCWQTFAPSLIILFRYIYVSMYIQYFKAKIIVLPIIFTRFWKKAGAVLPCNWAREAELRWIFSNMTVRLARENTQGLIIIISLSSFHTTGWEILRALFWTCCSIILSLPPGMVEGEHTY